MKKKRGYGRDPHWLTCRYKGMCAKCSKLLKPGDRAFYYPSTKELLCEGAGCGGAASREFDAMVWDEENNLCM